MTAGGGGRVWAHVGQRFTSTHADVVVVGAGRMGAAVARQVRARRPDLSLLLLEEGGLPNEEGATLLAPGVWCAWAPQEQQARAERTRELLEGALNVCGVLELLDTAADGAQPDGAQLAASLITPEVSALIGAGPIEAGAWPLARLDRRGGTYSAGAVTLAHANAAVQSGAELMLNVRAELTGTLPDGRAQLSLHRLSVTNTHQVIVDHTAPITARQVIVAAGAAGSALVEAGLGVVSAHRAAYRQSLRLEVPSSAASVVLRAGGLTLRPRDGGYTVISQVPHPDPWGYVPVGGRLMDVPVGARRETLDALVDNMERLEVLMSDSLVLGRSVSDVPGAWVALPQGGWPVWQRLDAAHTLLLGGEHADLTGLAVAEELAQAIAQEMG